MSDIHAPSAENLYKTLPAVLQRDEALSALGQGDAEKLAELIDNTRLASLYTRIDEMDEELLDILAYDFKVDWWDEDLTLDEKRATLKGSWFVHRQMGTKAAVIRALTAIYPNTVIEEWFEYGGEPYWFRILIDVAEGEFSQPKHRKILRNVDLYKSLRSHVEYVRYYFPTIILEEEDSLVFQRLLMKFWLRSYGNESWAVCAYWSLPMLARFGAYSLPNAECLTMYDYWSYLFTEDNSLTFQRLRFDFRLRSYGIGMVFLDGLDLLDGSWFLGNPWRIPMSARLGAYTLPNTERLAASAPERCSTSVQNSESVTDGSVSMGVYKVGSGVTYLDGACTLDGTWLLGQVLPETISATLNGVAI